MNFVAKVDTVNFGQSIYRIDEDSGSVEIQMFLRTSNITNVTIEVFSVDGLANGKWVYIIMVS